MIEGEKFIEIVNTYFNFLVTEFEFKILDKKIRGNAFYDFQYGNETMVVSISYENIEDYLLVIVFLLEKNGQFPNFDDKTKTLHLNELNKLVMPGVESTEIILNAEYFSQVQAELEIERKLLKNAKELRLCLRHFKELGLAHF